MQHQSHWPLCFRCFLYRKMVMQIGERCQSNSVSLIQPATACSTAYDGIGG